MVLSLDGASVRGGDGGLRTLPADPALPGRRSTSDPGPLAPGPVGPGPRSPRFGAAFGGRPRWQVALAFLALVIVLIGGDAVTRLPSHRPFFGIDVPNADPQAVTALAAKLGTTPTVTSVFLKLDSRSVSQVLGAIPPAMTPFITLEPWSRTSVWDGKSKVSGQPQYSLASIIDGSHDAALTTLARQLGALHRTVYLRFAHEMNGSWYPWAAAVNGNSPAEYQQAWRHVHDLLAPIAGDLVKWVWSPNIVSGVGPGAPSLASLYPGDAYVDYLGLTGYSHGASVVDTYCPTLSALTGLSDKPVVLSEIGSDGSNKVSWLRDLGGFIKANSEITGFVYFNTSPQTTGATGNYRIDQQSADVNALRSTLTDLGLRSAGPSGPSSGAKSASDPAAKSTSSPDSKPASMRC
ncbi:MAG: glycoside hydrolase, family 26 [Frankiales bacterium]|nr:glycoside hydrolase, family 26 [Frankiales bacterium]